jgi:hypothetical protein
MTEQEAQTKWCPYASYRNRGGPQAESQAQCLASGCAKWRWIDRKSPKDLEERKHWPLIPNTNPGEPEGFCGP